MVFHTIGMTIIAFGRISVAETAGKSKRDIGDWGFEIADCGLRPPARRGHRAYAPEGLRIGARDRNATRAVYRRRVSDPHPFGMCGGFLVPP